MTYQQRIDRIRENLERPLLVSKLANLRYLTGFAGSNGYLFVGAEQTVFVTDGRYAEIAEALLAELPDVKLEVYSGRLLEVLGAVIGKNSEVALESEHVSWFLARALAKEIGAEPVPQQGTVEALRRVKDSDEVDALGRAARTGDEAYAVLDELVGSSITEAQLAWQLVDIMRRKGGKPPDWDPIVASGAHASRPHHLTGDEPVGDGLLLLDYGCIVDGYHSDMTRTTWLGGNRPGEDVERLYRAVAQAQLAAIEAVLPGAKAGDIDEAARSVLRDHGLAERFLHSTGHGIGLEIHEAPALRSGSEDVLQAGDVVTIEPGAYVPGVGGVRIEDMVLVTTQGAELLTGSPRDLTRS